MGLKFARAEKEISVELDIEGSVPESEGVVPEKPKVLLAPKASGCPKVQSEKSKVPKNCDSSPLLPAPICCQFCDNKFHNDVDYTSHANEVHRRYVLKSWKRCEHCRTYLPDETLLSRHKFRNHFHQVE